MQALILPASRGRHWFLEGFGIFRKNPLLLALPVLCYVIVVNLVKSIPIIGQVAVTLVIPVFSVSLMNACRLIEQGNPPPPQIIFSGFQKNLRPLLVLGAACILFATVIFGMAALIDQGVLFKLVFLDQDPGKEVLASGRLMVAKQLVMGLSVPLMMAYWYAPVLVAWHDLPAGKALFFSLVACARNWRAFLSYAATIIVFGVLLPSLVAALMMAVFSVDGNLFSIAFVGLVVLVLLPTQYASLYVSYRDVFVVINDNA
jgi:hypothetical protein